MTEHIWETHKIKVSAKADARHLWLTFGLAVEVDGEDVGKSPGHVEGMTTKVPISFIHNGEIIEGKVESLFLSSVLFTRYRVILNGEKIGKGFVVAKNWYMTYLFIGIPLFGFFMFLSMFG